MQVSWEVAECIALRKRNHSEYEGDICTTAPLIVEVVSWLETHGLLEYTNAMMALLLPLILYLIAKRSASSENLQHIAGTTINKDASSILLTAAYRNAALVTGSLTAIAILVMSVIFAEPFFWLRPLCMWSAIALSYDSNIGLCAEHVQPQRSLHIFVNNKYCSFSNLDLVLQPQWMDVSP
eukprot:gene10921-2995_t